MPTAGLMFRSLEESAGARGRGRGDRERERGREAQEGESTEGGRERRRDIEGVCTKTTLTTSAQAKMHGCALLATEEHNKACMIACRAMRICRIKQGSAHVHSGTLLLGWSEKSPVAPIDGTSGANAERRQGPVRVHKAGVGPKTQEEDVSVQGFRV